MHKRRQRDGEFVGPQPTPSERIPRLRTGRSYRVDDLSPSSQGICSSPGSKPLTQSLLSTPPSHGQHRRGGG